MNDHSKLHTSSNSNVRNRRVWLGRLAGVSMVLGVLLGLAPSAAAVERTSCTQPRGTDSCDSFKSSCTGRLSSTINPWTGSTIYFCE
jgi:hypothetical protein